MFKPSHQGYNFFVPAVVCLLFFFAIGISEASSQVSIQSYDTRINSGSTQHILTGVPAGAMLIITTSATTASGNCSVSSSPSLTWTKRADAHTSLSGDAEIHTAVFTAGGNITVTSNWGSHVQTSVCYVVVNQESAFGGVTAIGISQEFPSVNLTSSRANSLLFCVTSDYYAVDGATRQYRGTPTERYYYRDAGEFTTYHYTMAAPTVGSYTVGLISPSMRNGSTNSGGTAVIEVRTPSDAQPPSSFTLSSPGQTASQIDLSWTAATDNIAVTSYEVYVNGNLVTTTVNTSYSVTGLSIGTEYSIYVRAKDAAGNGTNSNTLAISTRSNNWSINGNSGTVAPGNFLGTTDSSKLVIKTNNQPRISVWPNGTVNIGGSDSTRPLFRVYPNGDFSAGVTGDYTYGLNEHRNGMRFNRKLGILEIGASNNIDTTASAISADGGNDKSGLIVNSDNHNTIEGSIRSAIIAGEGIVLPAGKATAYSIIAGEVHYLGGKFSKSLMNGWANSIYSNDTRSTLVTGDSNRLDSTSIGNLIHGFGNRDLDSSYGNLVSGTANRFAGQSQLIAGLGLVSRNFGSATVGTGNVDFVSLPSLKTKRPSAYGQYPVFSVGNSNDYNTIRSNVITVLFNGRTQINTTGHTVSLTESDVTPKAALEIVSSNSGVLLPRLTNAQRNAIAGGDLHNGLLLYNTDSSSFQFYNGAGWKNISSGAGSSQWISSGNNIYNSNAGLVTIGTDVSPVPADTLIKLAVKGHIYSTKLKVTMNGWADYVFQPGYKLPSLDDLEAFIRMNRHLPDVPSAEEVKKNGLDVGDNQAILLKKIEELTLHVIEINKKVEALSKENDDLKKRLNRNEK